MSDVPLLDLDAQLCFPLYAASRAFTKAYAPLLEPHGLTYPQYITLLALWSDQRPHTVGELGERLYLDSGTLTPLLKRLEAAGLISRTRDPEDERRVLIELAPAGEQLRNEITDVPLQVATMLDLEPGDAVALRTLLRHLLDQLS